MSIKGPWAGTEHRQFRTSALDGNEYLRLIRPGDIALAFIVDQNYLLANSGQQQNVLFFQLLGPDTPVSFGSMGIEFTGQEYEYLGEREESAALWTHLRKTRKWNFRGPGPETLSSVRDIWKRYLKIEEEIILADAERFLAWAVFKDGVNS